MKTTSLLPCVLAAVAILFSYASSQAQEKVVVIPLNTGGSPGAVHTVTSAGQVWMDRNLGALRVATKSADPDAYGTLYQWGRPGDGHEYRSSSTTTTLSAGDVPGHGSFIIASSMPFDWRSSQNDNLWQGESGINNPCPAGFRLPTAPEFEIERASWLSNDAAGAFASPLKLTATGYREIANGRLFNTGTHGRYWTSSVDVDHVAAHRLFFNSVTAGTQPSNRGYGYGVRCLQD